MCATNCIVGDIASVQHNLAQFHWFMHNNAWNIQTLLLKSPKLAKTGENPFLNICTVRSFSDIWELLYGFGKEKISFVPKRISDYSIP